MTKRVIAILAFLFVAQWSSRALADITITGTVGEIAVAYSGQSNINYVRFKFTDLNQTKTCTNQTFYGNGYAYLRQGVNCSQGAACLFHEIYAMLLVSKKGAPLTCTIQDNLDCQITSCTLP